jgi:ribosome-binding factor A
MLYLYNPPSMGVLSVVVMEMPGSKRALRVGDQISREIALLLLEKVRDPRTQGVTITGNRMSADLKTVTVYYSVMGEDKDGRRAAAGLDSAKRFIKREIAARLTLKYMPEIYFKHDASLATGYHLDKVFEQLHHDE